MGIPVALCESCDVETERAFYWNETRKLQMKPKNDLRLKVS